MTSDPPFPSVMPVALYLGGLDPSSGAGLLRDALTAWELGVYPLVVPTAETNQNGLMCLQITPPGMPPSQRLEALRLHLSGLWGVKLGLCALSDEELALVLSMLDAAAPKARIWDPIQGPTVGEPLHRPTDLRRMGQRLLRGGGWIVCPNLLEAAAFAGTEAKAPVETLVEPFLELGADAVWLKGGHSEGQHVEDLWVEAHGVKSLGQRARWSDDRRGTGCTLASAWLAFRLKGLDGFEAAAQAAQWLHQRWPYAVKPGDTGRPSFAPVLS